MSGSCATVVVIKGTHVYCGNAGDSKAMLFSQSKSRPSMAVGKTNLNARHGTELKSERDRIKAAGGKIHADGSVYGVLFPTRGWVSGGRPWDRGAFSQLLISPGVRERCSFGDLDVKSNGKDVIIATPDGLGISPQPPHILDPSDTTYLVLASYVLFCKLPKHLSLHPSEPPSTPLPPLPPLPPPAPPSPK